MFQTGFTMFGTTPRLIYNESVAFVRMTFRPDSVTTAGWFDICQLPIKSKYLFYFCITQQDGSKLNGLRDARIKTDGMFGAYLYPEDTNKTLYCDFYFIPDIN